MNSCPLSLITSFLMIRTFFLVIYYFFLKRPIKQNFNQPLEFVSRSLIRNCPSDKHAAVLTLPQCRVLSKFSHVNHNVDQNRYWRLLPSEHQKAAIVLCFWLVIFRGPNETYPSTIPIMDMVHPVHRQTDS